MTLNVSAVSTPAPASVVNNAGSTGAVNFDNFPTAAPKDTRRAMAAPAVVAGGAALLIAGVAVVYLAQRSQLESGPVIDARTSAQLDKLLADKADEIMQTLNGLKGVADFMQQPIPLPSREAVMKQLTSLYDEGKRAGGNFGQMAERFAKQLTGQGGGASSVPTVPQAQPRPAPSVSAPPRATPAAPPVNPVALQQARASMAVANTLTQANTVAPNAYAAMEKFYQAASGGRAARAAGALDAPLQSVRQAYSQLGAIVATADKQMAAASPADRTLLGQWRNTVAQSRQAIGQWLPGAMAFSQGRAKPNGPAVANPTMPRPPGLVLEPTGRGQDVQGRRLADGYTQAARQAGAASPIKPGAPPGAPANTDAATQAMLTQSNAPLQRINTGVQAFYQQAAGGQAARQRGALAPSLKQVAEARAGLNKSILAANKLMADSSAQARPSLEAGLKNLRQARDAINAWLPQANAFAAGRSAPNGKRVAQPLLPATPTFVSTPANVSPKDVAASWIKARNAAGNTLAQSAQAARQTSGAQPSATVTNQKPSQTAAAPNVKFVDKFSPSVKQVAPVWVNPVTGEASATAKTGKDWVKAQAGLSLAANTSGSDKPPNIKWTDGKNTIEFRLPGGGGKGPRLLAAIGAIGSLLFVGSAVWGSADAYFDRREKAWLETANTSFKPFNSPPSYPNADAKAQGLVTMWKSYLDQVPGLIEKNHVSESDDEIASVQKEFAAHGADFLQGLANDRDALKNMSDAEKTNLLDTMSRKKLPEFSSTIKGTEQRPTRLMAALTKKLNESVAANSAGQIAGRRIAAQKPSGPTAPAPVQPSDDGVAKAKASLYWKIGPNGVPSVNTINVPPITSGGANSPTLPSAPSAVGQSRPLPMAAWTVAQAQAAQKKDEAKALNTVATAVKRENLESPPNLTALGNLRFTLDMFIDKSQRGDPLQLQLAREKGDRIFDACIAAEEGSATVATKARVQGTASKTLRAVIEQIVKLQTAPQQSAPAVKPSVAPTGADPVPKPTQSLDSGIEPSAAPREGEGLSTEPARNTLTP